MRLRGGSLVGLYLAVGLGFQVLYFGVPWPLHPPTWLHVLGWPAYLVLGLLRRLFVGFALLVLIGLAGIVALRSRRTG